MLTIDGQEVRPSYGIDEMTGYGIYLNHTGQVLRLHAARSTLRLLMADLDTFTPYDTQLLGVVITDR